MQHSLARQCVHVVLAKLFIPCALTIQPVYINILHLLYL